MTPRLNTVLLILALMIGVPFYWLMIDNRPGDAAAKPITLAQLRTLAAAIPGPHPVRAEMHHVGYRRALGDLVVAGSGFKRRGIGVLAWTLPIPGRGPLVIDTGLTAAQAQSRNLSIYDPREQARITAAMRRADLILVTQEHVDHLGGLAAMRDPGVYARAALNPRQQPGRVDTAKLGWAPDARYRTISGTAPSAVAPGVVVIPAPSHAPGSQMIFVTLQDGTELLFTGDISTLASNWRRLRAGSRWLGDVLGNDDRDEVFAWLKTIRAWKQQAPRLVVVPGHDVEYLVQGKFRGIVTPAGPPRVDDALANAGNF
jgi:glyoxylase-like metal-dependent hydrolase (beta-lactamase superfamily II)